ncbi:MAG: ribonuclease HII [Armatimonadaceae bacterium]
MNPQELDPIPYDSQTAGVDEVGLGPLAGPVVAVALLLPDDFDTAGITDSKKMTEAAREKAYIRILDAGTVGIGIVDADEIDRRNILNATHHAMRLALTALPSPPVRVLVDGLPVPDLHPNCEAIVKGDLRCSLIAAASVVAKVTRDRLMCEYHTLYPEYGFNRHKGYGTRLHLAALQENGPCPLHRRSFAPVSQLCLRFPEADTRP